jgi:hypothetical protein
MTTINYWRQLDIVDSSELERTRVIVIGAGGIGSPTVLALTKMGVRHITVYDDDSVESHNLPNQMYRLQDLEYKKVDALANICKEYSGIEITVKAERYENQPLSGIVISGVDTMSARKKIWENIRYNPNVKLYIEARMAAEIMRIHSIRPCDPSMVLWYETTLYDSADKTEAPCTARAIIYNVFVIAGLIDNQVKKYIMMQDVQKEILFDLATLTLITR